MTNSFGCFSHKDLFLIICMLASYLQHQSNDSHVATVPMQDCVTTADGPIFQEGWLVAIGYHRTCGGKEFLFAKTTRSYYRHRHG